MRKSELVAARLRERLQNLRSNDDGILPTIRELAGQFSCSVPTVIGALELLGSEGVIRRLSYRNRYISSRVCQPDLGKLTFPTRHLRLARQIKEDILANRLITERSDFLPTMKSLKKGLQCSHGTLQKALEVLVREGFVEELAKGYRAVRQSAPAQQSHVYFASSSSSIFMPHGRVLVLVNTIEHEIARREWPNLRYLLADDFTADKLPSDHNVSGYIYLSSRVANLAPLLRARKRHIPLVRIDPEERNRPGYESMKHYFCLSPDNSYAGRAVGMHLKALGHRHCVFLSNLSPDARPWSARRLAGLADVFTLTEGGARSCAIIKQRSQLSSQHMPEIEQFERSLSGAHSSFGRTCEWGKIVAGGVFNFAWEALAAIRLGVELRSVFEEALSLERVTAWVCANDQIAVAAQSFLNECAGNRARSIAVVGFDNSPLSYSLGITSYDFDYGTMGKLAVSCLESPGHMLSIAPDRSLSIKGHIVIRESPSS